MKKMITDYKVVESTTLSVFNRDSQTLISEGYQPKGKLHVYSVNTLLNTRYVQLFVKKEK